ncbi:MAG TPA: class I poly(R)-hydroxyalkanoic acid synthase, partial [Burkholderiales bacterium]|nr:class I poly(R)-hydroxyalkanoic acid synthase [Burkholderiales bacterium]
MAVAAPNPAEHFAAATQALLKHFLGSLGAAVGSSERERLELDTAKLAGLQARLLSQHAELWQVMLSRRLGGESATAAVAAPGDRSDRRFASPEWQRDPWFDYLRRSYLINSQFVSDWVEALSVDTRAKERLRFVARQFADAMSPANFAATNPDAIKLALDTKGESLACGVRQLIEDTHRGRISTTDEARF